MTQTYAQLKKHIAELQAQAESAKSSEVASVIARAKEAIRTYGLTRQDLFDGTAVRTTKPPKAVKGAKGKPVRSTEAKYADGKGGVWVGRGKRPQWLNDRLNAGARLEDFLAVRPAGAAAAPPATAEPATPVATPDAPRATPASKKRAASKVAAKKAPAQVAVKKAARPRYQDGAGNSWGGFGPRPKWLKDAIAGGRTLEDFLS